MSFRTTSSQNSLFASANLLSKDKQEKLDRDWPGLFAAHILPLIDESKFAHFYHEKDGRPNKSVRMMVGVLMLKELNNLTDQEALGALAFDLRWHRALNLTPEEAYTCQKTLHNFRVAMVNDQLAYQLLRELTTALAEKLGTDTTRQRMDSTQIASNIAKRNRMGLFAETIRFFLKRLRKRFGQEAYEQVSASLRGRYFREDGHKTSYEDASRSDLNRRLGVAARDVWRLLDQFRGWEKVTRTNFYQRLERLFREQCDEVSEPVAPKDDDADAEEGAIPVTVKDPQEVERDSLQTPHDPGVTYSGHKGQGYEVQIAETHGNQTEEAPDQPELITYVELSDVCGSDAQAVAPAMNDLAENDRQPEELLADTPYANTANVIAAEDQGTELVGPVGPRVRAPGDEEVTVGDFAVDVHDAERSACPTGYQPLEQSYDAESGELELVFDGEKCEACELRELCPAKREKSSGNRKVSTTRHKAKLESRKREQTTERFKNRYAKRAGIEGANAELKGKHGLGRLRVRGRARVRHAVGMKALMCNVKRSLRALAAKVAPPVCAEEPVEAVIGIN